MTKLASKLLGTKANGLSNLVLGMTIEEVVLSHGNNIAFEQDGGSVIFNTYKCAGASCYVTAYFEGGLLVSFESFAEMDDNEQKTKALAMKALKKELAAELTKLYGKPTKNGSTPYWHPPNAQIYLMSWRGRGNFDMEMPPRESLKIGMQPPT